MAKIASPSTQGRNVHPALDCVRYEEITDKWQASVPTSEEVEWYTEHERTCALGIHLPGGRAHSWDVSPEVLLESLTEDPARPSGVGTSHAVVPSNGTVVVASHRPISSEACGHARQALDAVGAIERDFDYILPSGFHSDTHINVGRVCESEAALTQTAKAYAEAIGEAAFDALLTTGWAMATVGRRFLSLLPANRGASIQHIVAEGYRPATLLGTLRPGSRVIVFVDVVVTGTLVREILRSVRTQGGVVCRVIALVKAVSGLAHQGMDIEAFCKIEMSLASPPDCSRCGCLPSMEFNPVAYRMTRRKSERSVSQFLDEHPDISEMWDLVLRADAFNRHRTVGARHYAGFIDTALLLGQESIRADLVARLCERAVGRAGAVPGAVLVPNRQTARVLGASVVQHLRAFYRAADVELVVARRGPGRAFALSEASAERLRHQAVIVVDAASAYGDTLDELSLLASRAEARLVTAGVLVSRLTEPGEAAFDARLSGGFVRLFAFPVRPIRSGCSECQRMDELRRATRRLSAGPARELAIRLTKRPPRYVPPQAHAEGGRQLELFAGDPLLDRQRALLMWCPPRIAAAVTANAIHAARGDGMAPLSIPEIFDLRIPSINKVAMLEALPRHSLLWNREPLGSQLFDYLDHGREPDVWLAIAGLLAREGRSDWIGQLNGVLDRSASWLKPDFWLRAQMVTLELAQAGPRAVVEGEARIREVMAAHPNTPALEGLEGMIETMRAAAPDVTARTS